MKDRSSVYTAVLQSKNHIQIFDTLKGVKTFSINLGQVEVINGPVITTDKMTIVIKNNSNRLEGRVYTLPRGMLSYTFPISK